MNTPISDFIYKYVQQPQTAAKTSLHRLFGKPSVWESDVTGSKRGLIYLVGGLEHLFSIIYGIILPIDYFFSEGLKPPTSYVNFSYWGMVINPVIWINI